MTTLLRFPHLYNALPALRVLWPSAGTCVCLIRVFHVTELLRCFGGGASLYGGGGVGEACVLVRERCRQLECAS